MKKTLVFLLAAMMVLSMAFSAVAETVELGDTLTVAVGHDPDTLNPGIAANNERYERLLFSGLVWQEGTEIVPDLAESWEMSEDGLTWTFKLRDNVFFHNGKKLTSADVKASYDRFKTNQLTHSGKMAWIKEVNCPDDLTVEIVCDGPYPLVLSSLAGHWALVLDADCIEKYGNDLGLTAESVNGTGPYTMKTHIWDEKYEFVANPNYFKGEPSITNLNFVIIPDASSRTIALEAGEIDLICGVNASDVGLLQDEGFPVEFTLSNGQYFFMYNCSEYSVCNDPKVRLAINHAVDTAAIVNALYTDVKGEVPTSFATSRDYGTEDLGVFPYNPELSKQLLAEAGYPDGITLKLFAYPGYAKNPESAEIVKQMCAQVGINIEITVGDNAAFMEIFGHTPESFDEQIGYDMFCMGQGPANCDLGGYQGLYTTDTVSNDSNYGFYSNAEVDELFAKQAVETNVEKRLEMLNRLNEILYLEDPVGLLIWNDATPFAMNDRILNCQGNVNIMGCVNYANLQVSK